MIRKLRRAFTPEVMAGIGLLLGALAIIAIGSLLTLL